MQKCSTKFSSKKHYLIPSFGSDNCTLVCTAIVATLTVQSVLTSRTGSYKYVLCEMLVTQTYYNNRDKVIWYSVQCVLQQLWRFTGGFKDSFAPLTRKGSDSGST